MLLADARAPRLRPSAGPSNAPAPRDDAGGMGTAGRVVVGLALVGVVVAGAVMLGPALGDMAAPRRA
jgi:hypothetical protein